MSKMTSATKKRGSVRGAAMACGFALSLGYAPFVLAQPPAPEAENMAYHVPEVEDEWNKLRGEVGALEFTQPLETIGRYQQFYETRGLRSATTAVKVGSTIAQIYWQQLGNPAKAVEIYDWMVQKFGDLPQMARLRQQRDEIVDVQFPQELVRAKSIRIGIPTPAAQVAPVKLDRRQQLLLGTAIIAPIALSPVPTSVPDKIAGSINTPRGMRPLVGKGGVKPESWQGFALPSMIEMPPIANRERPFIDPINLDVTYTGSMPGVTPINARHATLLGYVALWRSGKLSWEEMVETAAFTAEDIKLVAATRNVVSFYGGGAVIRDRLGLLIQTFPDLTTNWQSLPVPAQVALGEAYTSQRNRLAETIFHHLLKQEVPPGAWWNKELIMYRLGQYHAALGDYVKAAEVNLEIAAYTQHPAWHNDSFIVAARFYRQAGQEEKAAAFYKRAENGGHGWATGLSRYDQAQILIAQGNHEEAQRLLSLPLTGAMAEQIQVAVWSLLGRSYFETGDYQRASEVLQRAIQQKDNPGYEGLKEQVALARTTLRKIEQQAAQPVWVEPKELRFVMRKGERPVRRWITVRTKSDMVLQIKSYDSRVEAEVMPEVRKQGEMFEREIGVRVVLPKATERFETILSIGSPQVVDFEEKVRVIVEVNK